MWSTYVYNKEKKEIFGNTLISWLKIFLFYISFYTFLFSFWLFMLLVFLQTVNNDRPNWVHEESLLKMKPGLSFRPRIPFDKSDSSIIIYNLNNSNSYHNWIEDLNDFVKIYNDKFYNLKECMNTHLRSLDCPFLVDFNQNENPCPINSFGYDIGEPCFLIKLNRIFYWEPSPYRSLKELPKDVNKPNVDLEEGKGLILLECNGETQFDKDNIGKINYWPLQGFPAEKYPFTNQKHYLSPFVFIRLKDVRFNVPISIECKVHDKNIEIDKKDRIGYLQFHLLIETES